MCITRFITQRLLAVGIGGLLLYPSNLHQAACAQVFKYELVADETSPEDAQLEDESELRARHVRLNSPPPDASLPGARWTFSPFSNRTFDLLVSRLERVGPARIITCEVQGNPGSWFMISQVGDYITAQMHGPGEVGYFLRHTALGDYRIVEQSPHKAKFECAAQTPSAPRQPSFQRLRQIGKSGGGGSHIVKLMVYFSWNVTYYYGSDGAAASAIYLAVSQANSALANSAITPSGSYSFDLVQALRWSYNDSGNYFTDLENFVNQQAGLQGTLSYADSVGADLLQLWVKQPVTGGAAYVSTPGNLQRFSVITVGSAFAPRFGTAHELGHNCGLHHNYEDSPKWQTGANGFYSLDMSPNNPDFSDLMSGRSSGPILQLFSNPNVTYLGVPVGSTDPAKPANAAAALGASFPFMSAIR